MAAGFTKTDVERVAALARLALTDDEKVLFEEQIRKILQFAEQVCQLDTAGTVPTPADAPPGSPERPAQEPPRPDEVRPSLTQAQVLANAPDPAFAEGLFKVPRVIGG